MENCLSAADMEIEENTVKDALVDVVKKEKVDMEIEENTVKDTLVDVVKKGKVDMEIEENTVKDESVDVVKKEKVEHNVQDAGNGNKSLSGEESEDLQVKEENIETPDTSFKMPCFETFRKPQCRTTTERKIENENQGKIDDVNTSKPDQQDKIGQEKLEEKIKSKKVIGKPFQTPAEQLKDKSVPIPYKEPKWSGLPTQEYVLEVLKNGAIVDNIKLELPFVVVGRSVGNHIPMEHPSISRFHCVIQYRVTPGNDDQPRGFYAYDLGSTHGSFQNKHRMKPETYYHIRVGHMLKFGGSTRMFVLQGPDEDQEPETELSVTELMALAKQKQEKLNELESGEGEEDRGRRIRNAKSSDIKQSEEQSDGISWGMAEDAVDEDAAEDDDEDYDGENPFAQLNEELYLDDPKKTLRGWYEREGYDLPNYELSDISNGHYRCKVNLPIEGPGGGSLMAQVEHKGKKKDAVVQCALEACRMLDRKGVLRQAKHESREKKRKDWAENDYYDSDEDEFLDRTGDIEKKRIKRMKSVISAGNLGEQDAETYQSAMTKYNALVEELRDVENKLSEAERLKAISEKAADVDDGDVDDYMKKLKSQVPDKHKRVTWKFRMVELRKEEVKLRRLINIARPLGVTELKIYNNSLETVTNINVANHKKITKLYKGHSFSESSKTSKVFVGVHKAFLEEEPEERVRLSRLDDSTPMPESLPYKTNETTHLKIKKIPSKDSNPILPEEVLKARDKISEQLSKTDKTDEPIEKPESKNKEKMLARLKANQSFWKQGLEKAASNSWKQGLEKTTTNEKQKDKCNDQEDILTLRFSDIKESSTASIEENVLRSTPTQSSDEVQCKEENVEAVKNIPVPQEEFKKNIKISSDLEFKKARIQGPTSSDEVQCKVENVEAVKNIPVPQEEFKKNIKISSDLEFKKARILGPTTPQLLARNKEVKKLPKDIKKYDNETPEYNTWTPPVGQTGDGRTRLNDKLGY